MLAALALAPGVYNVADDEPVTHRSFVDSLADDLGVPHPWLPPPWMTAFGGSLARMLARSVRVSNRKLRAACDWVPAFPSVREGWPTAVAPFVGRTPPDLRSGGPQGGSPRAQHGATTPPAGAP